MAKAIVSLLILFVLSGCIYPPDYDRGHHRRRRATDDEQDKKDSSQSSGDNAWIQDTPPQQQIAQQPLQTIPQTAESQPLVYNNPNQPAPQRVKSTPIDNPPSPFIGAAEDEDQPQVEPALANCPPIDIPTGATISVLYSQRSCRTCKPLIARLEKAGVHVGTSRETNAPIIKVMLKSKDDFIRRNITKTPTIVNFKDGVEETRTVGYGGKQEEIEAIIVRLATYKRPVGYPVYPESSSYVRQRDYDQFLHDGDPRLVPGQTYTAVDCGNPEHPAIGSYTVPMPVQSYTTVTAVDCGRPDHPVLGTYQLPMSGNCGSPSMSYGQWADQTSYQSQQIGPHGGLMYSAIPIMDSGSSSPCGPNGCPPPQTMSMY